MFRESCVAYFMVSMCMAVQPVGGHWKTVPKGRQASAGSAARIDHVMQGHASWMVFAAVSAAHVGHVLRREVVQDVGGAPQGARDEGVPRVHVQRRVRPAAGAHKPSGLYSLCTWVAVDLMLQLLPAPGCAEWCVPTWPSQAG